jgi:hypothetical protein
VGADGIAGAQLFTPGTAPLMVVVDSVFFMPFTVTLPPLFISDASQPDEPVILDEFHPVDEERPSEDAVIDALPATSTALLLLELTTTPHPLAISWLLLLILSVVPEPPSMHTQVWLN